MSAPPPAADSFDVARSWAERARAFCRDFIDGTRPRFILGRNQYAASVADAVEVDGFADDFTPDLEFRGRPVVKLEALPADSLVLNCVPVGRPLTAQRRIDHVGLDNLDYYAFLKHSGLAIQPIEYWVGFEEHFQQRQDDYRKLYDRLSDPLSKEILSRLINFRRSYDLDHMRIFCDAQHRQYFESFIAFGEDEVFADIGAFDGLTSEAFAQRCPGYRGIFVFEPNPRSLEAARRKLGEDPRIRFVPAAVGAEAATLRFADAGSSSRLSDRGATEVSVQPLDAYQDVPFTFLKMDVEGGEAAAISGARRIIESRRPRLAVSVYHKAGDLIDIPWQVLAIRDDYDLRLRHYTEGFTETVMYFLPRG